MPDDPAHIGFNEPQPATAAHTKLVIKDGERHIVPYNKSEDWVDPPLPGGFQVAIPATIYTQKDLFTWANYLSPPRGWPQAFTYFAPMKSYISGKLQGRRVRLTDGPHPLEKERLRRLLQGEPEEGHARFNAVAVRRALGWQIVGGYILLEERQGGGRKVTAARGLEPRSTPGAVCVSAPPPLALRGACCSARSSPATGRGI